jgi:hypothetical protein
VLSSEAFYRNFDNRRGVAGYAGLMPSPCLKELDPTLP